MMTMMIPLPASTIWPASDWSSLLWGSVESMSKQQMSDSSMAARVLMAENFSRPTSRLPGLRRPAVSSISRSRPLYFNCRRLMSRVVPCFELTIACCLRPRVLNRDDLPTFGRPMRAILSGAMLDGFSCAVVPWSSLKELFKFLFSSLMPGPVVAEV